MKAAVLKNYDPEVEQQQWVDYEEVDEPEISHPLEIIVRIGGAGVCRTDLHVIDKNEATLRRAVNFGIADTVVADGNEVERVKDLTQGHGAEAVIDFVAEGETVANGLAMTRNAGTVDACLLNQRAIS